MKIKWEIEKKRGNWRPTLTYTCTKLPDEVNLAIPAVVMGTKIPEPPNSYRDICMPDTDERNEGWVPKNFTTIKTPRNNEQEFGESLKLPWRPGAKPRYPEVEEAFALLQEEWEKCLEITAASAAIHLEGSLDHTKKTKDILAPIVARRKITESNAGGER
jgi:hypothetical protein